MYVNYSLLQLEKKANIFIMQKTQNFSKFIATYD